MFHNRKVIVFVIILIISLNLQGNDQFFLFQSINSSTSTENLLHSSNSYEFINRNNVDNKVNLQESLKISSEKNSDNSLLYTTVTTKNYNTAHISLLNGQWNANVVSGQQTSSQIRKENSSFPLGQQLVDFLWFENPDWSTFTSGLSNSTINLLKNDQYQYFDNENNSALDFLYLNINTTNFVLINVSQYISALESQLNAYFYNQITELPSFTWNVTQESWSSFRSKLFSGIAYSATISKLDVKGNIQEIKFIPNWIGNYWAPAEILLANSVNTSFVNSYYVSHSDSPIDSLTGKLKTYYDFYSKTNLNVKRQPFSSLFNDMKINFESNQIEFEFNTRTEDFNRYTFHTEDTWLKGNLNKGTFYEKFVLKYDSNSGVLQNLYNLKKFDFGINGSYINTLTYNLERNDNTTFIIVVISVLSIVVLVILFRKKLKIAFNRLKSLTDKV